MLAPLLRARAHRKKLPMLPLVDIVILFETNAVSHLGIYILRGLVGKTYD